MSTASFYAYIPESETEVYYPKSKRRVKLNSKGEIISDTAKNTTLQRLTLTPLEHSKF